MMAIVCAAAGLLHFDEARSLLFFFFGHLGQGDGEDAVDHRGGYAVSLYIVGKAERLSELGVGELAAQVAMGLFVVALRLGLFLHRNAQVAVFVKANLEVVFVHSRSGHFDFVVCVGFNHIDGQYKTNCR